MEQLSDRDLDYLIRHADKLDPAQQQHVLALLEAREKRAHIERARKRFTAFVEAVWPDFIAGAHHKLMAEKFEAVAEGRLKRLIIDMPPRHQLRIDTPIPTTDGWKTMAEVREGDFVFSPSGAPVRVTGKSPIQEADLYEVVTSDGQIVECDGEHLWAVSWNHKPFVTMSAAEIAHKLDAEAWRAHGNLPTLPPVAPVEYPERNLLVPPYVLGAWLGDGSATDGSMTTHPDDAAFMRARFEASGVPTTDVKAKMRFGTRHLRVKLRDIGVLHDKHIPQEYLTAHPAQRLALLQGLMDTDGTVSKDGKCTFHNSNLRLMQDVQELVHSFGLKTQITRRQTHYKHHVSQPSYRLSFKMAGAASLPRKAERTRAMEGNWARSIDVRKTGRRGAVQCLKVANDDGLFLAGRGYVVTHNTKSEFASWLLPAWFFGNFPKKKIIQVSNTEALAAGFGRRVRNLLDVTGDDGMTEESRAYHEIFPNVRLAADSKAAANWHTSSGGEYFAVGVNGKVTGKGADIAIVDDPHSEQEARQAESTPEIFDGVYEWYTSGIRQRLQPGGSIIIVVTRWSKRDLVGQVLRSMETAIKSGVPEDQYDNWDVLSLPAIIDEHTPTERSMWPGFWPLEELQRTRNALPVAKWQAQYQQNPTSEGAAIIKRDSWRKWGALANEGRAKPDKCPGPMHLRAWNDNEPPACKFVIQSWDAAATAKDRSHPSAMTLWGVFDAEDPNTGKTLPNLILLSAFKDRMEFPALKRTAKTFYDEDKPDVLLIENKSAGMQLLQEFRSMGIPAESFAGSSRGTERMPNDKVARANMIADIFSSGYVWAPERRFAEEVIEQCASFPAGDEDDYVDSTVQALLRFRQGGLIRTANDQDEQEDAPRPRRRRYY